MKAMVLAGGFGTRLAHIVKDVPKPMAPVGTLPFLELLLRSLATKGIREFILLTGYMHDQIESYLKDGSSFGFRISYSRESSPLGTGGAVNAAIRLLFDEQNFILVNGDTYFEFDLESLESQHEQTGAIITMALKYIGCAERYGAVELDHKTWRISGFREKRAGLEDIYINAGVYMVNTARYPIYQGTQPFSFEEVVIQHLMNERMLYGLPFGGKFIDIGVPEDYFYAQKELSRWMASTLTPALFIDRDNTIIRDNGYVHDLNDISIIPEVLPLMQVAIEAGVKVIIISNQAGIAKGRFSKEDSDSLNTELICRLKDEGIRIDGIYTCPYHDEGCVPYYTKASLDRKPFPGMILKAAEDHGIDISKSIMVGDKESDRIYLPYLTSIIVKPGSSEDYRRASNALFEKAYGYARS